MDDIATPKPSHEPLPVKHRPVRAAPKAAVRRSAGRARRLLYAAGTHGFHWNVVGPQFHSLHEMFEEQYQDLQDAVDEIAERIRALGFLAPGSLSQFLKLTSIKDEHEAPKAQDMLRELVEDNETVVRACRGVVRICHEADDTVTEDLMNQRLRAHEKAAWMLRASLQP